MKFIRNKNSHVRFEPDVDNGTTYAFDHKKGVLIIGRKKMYNVLSALSNKEQELEFLYQDFIDSSGNSGYESYTDEKELMIDLMKLVNADVIRVFSAKRA